MLDDEQYARGIAFDVIANHFNGQLTSEQIEAIGATVLRSVVRRRPAALPSGAEPVGWRVRAKNMMGKFPWKVVADDQLATAIPEDQRDLYEIVPLVVASPLSSSQVTEERVDRALAYWCSKLPKAQREQPVPDKLRDHMRATLEAAALYPVKGDGQ